ncbi:MAG: PilZ domain-containing protein [Hyphomicrobiaceae bacterium]|nr:PilZ domain-containing protein [Hyphomicrobiaceae bacterium]
MTQAQALAMRPGTSVLTRIMSDKRRFKRIPVDLAGRYMREDKLEYPCRMIDMSAGGAAVRSDVRPLEGERVVASFEHIGMLEGTVARAIEGGFAFKIHATKHKREKLVAQLMWLANRSELDGADERRHERITPPNSLAILQIGDDPALTCRLIDISISGASVATNLRPPLGTEVMLGKLRARIVRHHPQGIGLQFLDVQNPTALRRYFG